MTTREPDSQVEVPLEVLAMRVKVIHFETKNCLNCYRFVEGPDLCTIAQARPPARVIVTGCQAWEDRRTPF